MSLSFDGKGINGPDEFRTRLATFITDEDAKSYGPLFAAAPDLLAALEAIMSLVKVSDEMLGQGFGNQVNLTRFQIQDARAAIAKATT